MQRWYVEEKYKSENLHFFYSKFVWFEGTYARTHSLSLLFLWGKSQAQQSYEVSKCLVAFRKTLRVLLSLQQDGTKQGRRCNRTTWATSPWV